MATLLAVDDEAQILTALSRGFERVGHEVLVAQSGQDALGAVATAAPDVVLLDLHLPDLDGIEVVRRIRSWSPVPILLLSGAGSERSRIAALDAGADDFVDKPFSMEELRARVDATLRRSAPPADPGSHVGGNGSSGVAANGSHLQVGELSIDLAERRLTVAGRQVRLTPTEWRLLEALVRQPGRLLTYRQVITEVWSAQHGDEARDSLRAHLRSLRRKLGDDAAAPRFIATEPAAGYRWLPTPDG